MPDECSGCHYYLPVTEASGLCRCNPPVVFFDPHGNAGQMYQSMWPEVKPTDWCGEFDEPPLINP